MTAEQYETWIELVGHTNPTQTTGGSRSVSDEAVLRLARLIGRQIAREQFERKGVANRKSLRKKSDKSF